MKNKYEIRGDITTIYIEKKDGTKLECLVDTADFPLILELSGLYAHRNSMGGYYVVLQKKKKNSLLHRWLLKPPRNMYIDHFNHNTLDNRRSNLRIVTPSENSQNRKGVKNVYYHKRCNRYYARLRLNYKYIFLGWFKEEVDAERAALEGRKKYMPNSQEAV